MALILFISPWLRKEGKLKPNNVAFYFSRVKDKEFKRYYKILDIDESSDQEQIRLAYLDLVKRYHPDSGTEEANEHKFQEIDEAYKTLMHHKSEEKWGKGKDFLEEANIVQEQDIKHTAPQHRQYLSYDGIGSGNLFQREKQYTNVRAMQASQNVYNHRISKIAVDEKTLTEKVPLKHKIKTKYGFERLVEDLIQESMSKGEFQNLKNFGKPLPDKNRNPYVDFVTHKLNEVLIDNGFTPEWILLQKEIREEAQMLRRSLFLERQYFGPYPLSIEDNIEWSEKVYKYKKVVDTINKKIAKYNLLVPVLNKQMLQVCLEKEAQKAVINGDSYEDLRYESNHDKSKKKLINAPSNDGLFGFIDYFFRGK